MGATLAAAIAAQALAAMACLRASIWLIGRGKGLGYFASVVLAVAGIAVAGHAFLQAMHHYH